MTIADANDLDLTTKMTLEAWVYPATTNNVWRAVIAKELSGDLAYAMMAGRRPRTALRPHLDGGEQLAQGTSALAPTRGHTWRPPTTARPFGSMSTARSSRRSRRSGRSPRRTSRCTSAADALNEWFNGRLDDVRVYNRTLTQAEIKTDMDAPAG